MKTMETRPGKRLKKIMRSILMKKMRGQIELEKTTEKQLEVVSSRRKEWKPKIEKLNNIIINEGNIFELNKYYHLYIGIDRLELENAIIRYMILSSKNFEDVKDEIPKDPYERLLNRRKKSR